MSRQKAPKAPAPDCQPWVNYEHDADDDDNEDNDEDDDNDDDGIHDKETPGCINKRKTGCKFYHMEGVLNLKLFLKIMVAKFYDMGTGDWRLRAS